MEQETKSLYERKGQAAGAVSSIIVLITGLGVSVLVLIFVGALGGQTYELVESDLNNIGVHPITGESHLLTNLSVNTLNHSPVQNGTIAFYNGTHALGLSNFSISNVNSGFTLTNGAYNGTTWSVNYTYGNIEIQHSVKNGVLSGFEALQQTGDYLPIVVLAVVISLVLMLVLGMTAFGGGMQGRGSAL